MRLATCANQTVATYNEVTPSPTSSENFAMLRLSYATHFGRLDFAFANITRFLFAFLFTFCPFAHAEDGKDANTRQFAWTSSKVKGSPDPPLPYKTSQVFPGVKLTNPTEIAWYPNAEKWIANHSGDKIVSFDNDPVNAVTKPLLSLSEVVGAPVQTGYTTLFHYDQENQPWCFVTYTTKRQLPDGHHWARLKVIDPSIPSFDLQSLKVLAQWKSHGHVGSSMQFGPDGMLYLSIGDGQPPYPPDGDNTGQDLTDLRGSILRVDVSAPTNEHPYRIPKDNPFINDPLARDEIWSFGYRNPWKIAFDPKSGELLAADVGWETHEMIYRVKRGRNHGWSIMEGSQVAKPGESPRIPITPPLFEHTHLDSRSITGGHFWHSDRIPELEGAYIYGDWMTGKVWGLRFEGDKVTWHQELVDTPLKIICFMLDPTGEIFIVGYDGTILQLHPNTGLTEQEAFPTQLSQTGLFTDTVAQSPAPGVVEYDVRAKHWADGTHSRQWLALPETSQLTLFKKFDWTTGESAGRFNFPMDTVAAKTVSYFSEAGNPKSEKHIETQVLHKYGDEWRAYNYIWNDEQTDAFLQPDTAQETELTIRDSKATGGKRKQTWRHSSRSECLLCHLWSAGTVQGFWPPQLNLEQDGHNQLDTLSDLGLFAEDIPKLNTLVSPHDPEASLQDRARSYLALNCSTCHRNLGGGMAEFTFDITVPLSNSKYIDAAPSQGAFGIPQAKVVASGSPSRSVLLYRTLKSGRGHMPQFGSSVIDRNGISLLAKWIASLGDNPKSLTHSSPFGESEIIEDAAIAKAISSIEGAVSLALACNDEALPQELANRVAAIGAAHQHAPIRDLFEQYLPEDQRVKRLGALIDEAQLLSIKGSAERGRALFESAADINCRNCHRIGQVGQSIGPDLSGIGSQQTASELLASILRPSEKIDPKYRAKQVLTFDGKVLTGLLVSETESQIELADSAGKTSTIDVADIEDMRSAPKSTMPEQLLSGLTAEQAGDLLAFLTEQKAISPLQHKHARIYRATAPVIVDGDCDEAAWDAAQELDDFVFTWWQAGDPPQQQTKAKLLWDDEYLYIAYQCADKDIQATRHGRDSQVYRDDCVEVFASPEFAKPENYFNLEMNALGEQLDQYRPGGKMLEHWDPDGIQIGVSIDGTLNDSEDEDRGWSLEVAIPFRHFANVLTDSRPAPGDRWRLNLSRLEDNMASKSQWSQGDRNYPRFHHPEYFGFVEFVGDSSPNGLEK